MLDIKEFSQASAGEIAEDIVGVARKKADGTNTLKSDFHLEVVMAYLDGCDAERRTEVIKELYKAVFAEAAATLALIAVGAAKDVVKEYS